MQGMWKAAIPLLEAMGQLEYDSQGRPMMSDKGQYFLMNMFPPVSAAERLFPSTEQYQQRGLQSRLSWLGVPIRQVPPEQQKAELARRISEVNKAVKKQQLIEGGK